ncbi:MAG: GNAT family N-acetyltransferase [Caldilineaceae bacterium]|nr:GNAT family N-acetyltransferase [Caldilineaceae bacterium]
MTAALPFSASHLMELHINTLFCSDSDGRLRCVNEASDPPAPLFYMGRTLHKNLWRFRYDLPATTIEKLDELCQSEPLAVDLASPPQNEAAIKAVLDEHRALPAQKEYRGPAYWIPDGNPVPAHAVIISEANAELVQDTFPWILPLTQDQEAGPVAAAIDQDRAVSVCFCSRRPLQATEAGLETLPAFRGKGHATAAVALWAEAVRRQGTMPMYSTSWDNLASQAVARKLRMVLYGGDWSIA